MVEEITKITEKSEKRPWMAMLEDGVVFVPENERSWSSLCVTLELYVVPDLYHSL